MESRTYSVPSIHCGHCVGTIERELSELEGVRRVRADQMGRMVEVEFEAPATEGLVTALLAEINYPVTA